MPIAAWLKFARPRHIARRPREIRGTTRTALSGCLDGAAHEIELSRDLSARTSTDAWPHPRRAWYALGVLTVGLLIATIDRTVIQLLIGPIKRDLGLSDLQVSYLIGPAFVIVYAFLGLPIARLADRHSRRLIIGIGIAFWSLMTALCGIAGTYRQLFWARAGVGAGESSFAPATFSILTDSFPPRQLPRALAINAMGFTCGTALATIVGGAVIEAFSDIGPVVLPVAGQIRPWQLVFVAVSLPGFVLALVMATVHEPRRHGLITGSASLVDGKPRAVPIPEILRFVGEEWKTFAPIFIAMGIKTMLTFGTTGWMFEFFSRTYGWATPQTAYRIGVISLILSPLGLLAGSWLAERLARRGHDDANIRVLQIATVAVVPTSILYPLMPDPYWALTLAGLNLFIASLGIAPANAALQIVTPNEMRGQVRAAYQFVFNVVGYASGPVFVALFTDLVFGSDASLRYSLAASAAIMGPLAAFVTWYGMKPYARSVVRSRAWA
jgi:MFS family permease